MGAPQGRYKICAYLAWDNQTSSLVSPEVPAQPTWSHAQFQPGFRLGEFSNPSRDSTLALLKHDSAICGLWGLMKMTTETAKDALQLAASRAEDIVCVAAAKAEAILAAHAEDRTEAIAERAACKAIDGFFIRLGVDTRDPIAMQKDFATLRSFRESVELVKKRGLITAVTIVVTGVRAAVWGGR